MLTFMMTWIPGRGGGEEGTTGLSLPVPTLGSMDAPDSVEQADEGEVGPCNSNYITLSCKEILG